MTKNEDQKIIDFSTKSVVFQSTYLGVERSQDVISFRMMQLSGSCAICRRILVMWSDCVITALSVSIFVARWLYSTVASELNDNRQGEHQHLDHEIQKSHRDGHKWYEEAASKLVEQNFFICSWGLSTSIHWSWSQSNKATMTDSESLWWIIITITTKYKPHEQTPSHNVTQQTLCVCVWGGVFSCGLYFVVIVIMVHHRLSESVVVALPLWSWPVEWTLVERPQEQIKKFYLRRPVCWLLPSLWYM